ncbi:MAG: DUF2970 domain-containing protein [Burkholderiaceae bacterium]
MAGPRPSGHEPPPEKAAGGSFLATVKAVAWSFFGVRRSRDHQADFERLSPVHVVIVGVLMGVLFVLTLLFVVRQVVG